MASTRLKSVLGTIVVAGALAVIVWQYQTLQRLRRDNELLRQQIAQLPTENESTAKRPAAADNSKPATDGDLSELLRLRGEVGMLRSQTNQLSKLQEQNQQLRQALTNVAQNQNTQPARDPLSPEEHAFAIREINASRQALLGMIMFANDHQNQFPGSFDEAAQYFANKNPSDLANLSHFEIIYRGSLANVSNTDSAIVLRSIQPWSAGGKFSKAYGFADGHSEVHSDPTGNFDTWEQEHAVVLKNQ